MSAAMERAFALAEQLDQVGRPALAELVRRVDPSHETLRAVEALVGELVRARPALALAGAMLATAEPHETWPEGAGELARVRSALAAAMGCP